MRDSPLGYANINITMMDRYRTNGCQSSSMNYGEVALRINDVNVLDRAGDFTLPVGEAMGNNDFWFFAESLQRAHNTIHGALDCTMSRPETAAYDPVFWLHHAFVDKKFADWQKRPEGQTALSGQFPESPGEPFDKNKPSISANPFPLTQGITE